MILKHFPEDFIVEEMPLFDFKGNGQFTYFLLEKNNYNTEDAVQKISEYFRIPRNCFSYAGNKDRIAITKQYVSVRGKLKDTKLNDLNIKIIGHGNKQISLGDLVGNKFKIVIRGIEKKPKGIEETINYFDEQRFGKNNLKIGFAIVKKNFKEAASQIDYVSVKEHLKNYPTDFVGAIRTVPFKTLKLFIHSVQSFLWNEAVYNHVINSKYNEIISESCKFAFPVKKIKNASIPLISFDTEFDSLSGKLYQTVLKKYSIDARDFIIRAIPDITPKGAMRDMVAKVNDLAIGKLEDDEISGKKKIQIEFWLGKGSYATIVIKNLFYES